MDLGLLNPKHQVININCVVGQEGFLLNIHKIAYPTKCNQVTRTLEPKHFVFICHGTRVGCRRLFGYQERRDDEGRICLLH